MIRREGGNPESWTRRRIFRKVGSPGLASGSATRLSRTSGGAWRWVPGTELLENGSGPTLESVSQPKQAFWTCFEGLDSLAYEEFVGKSVMKDQMDQRLSLLVLLD